MIRAVLWHGTTVPTLVLSLCILISSVSKTDAQECSKGFYRQTGVCIPCPPGTYQALGGQNTCIKCSAGLFNLFPGAKHRENCVKCPPGSFSSAGSTSCKKCPAGLRSLPGSEKCVKCKPGRGPADYDPICVLCPAGYFNDGSTFLCQKCPSGTIHNKMRTSCQKCPKGTFRDVRHISSFDPTTSKCTPCQIGSLAAREGTVQCALCPPGYSSTKGAGSCKSCQAGMFRLSPRSKVCLECPDGTSSIGKGPAGCMHPKKGCPENTFEVDGECRACSPGERLDAARKTCIPCGNNQVSVGGTVTECITCGKDMYPAPPQTVFENSRCLCKPGYRQNDNDGCFKCQKGEFWDDSNPGALRLTIRRDYSKYVRTSTCEACPGMTFSDTEGALECKPCPIGMVSGTRASKCVPCPKKTVPAFMFSWEEDYDDSPAAVTRCKTFRHNCGVGQIRTRDDSCKAVNCPSGTVKSGYGSCINCSPSQFFNTKEKDCEICPRKTGNTGYHVNTSCPACKGKGALEVGCGCEYFRVLIDGVCKKCLPGERPVDGKCRTTICTEGGHVPGKDGYCMKCDASSIRKNREDTSCTPCPKGQRSGRDLFGLRADRCVSI